MKLSNFNLTNRNKKRGFTLVELLVVISVIAMLIAILLPALAAARTTARMAGSMSQMRQIQTSMRMYIQDRNGVFPTARGSKDGGKGGWSINSDGYSIHPYWSEALVRRGYITDPLHIFWSPGRDRTSITNRLKDYPTKTDLGNFYQGLVSATGYGVNRNGAMPLYSYGPKYNYWPITIYQPGIPTSKLMTITEPVRTNKSDNRGWFEMDYGSSSTGLFTYSGNVVTGYVDGHAKAVKSKTLGWQPTGPNSGKWIAGFSKHSEPWYYGEYTRRGN